MNTFYEYNARVLRVVDADTVDLEVDLGFDIRLNMKVRLYGINAPELRTQAGKNAKATLSAFMPVGSEVVLHSYKDKREKYGRYLGVIFYAGANVNEWLVTAGCAVEQKY